MSELMTSNDKLALLSLSAAYEIDLRLVGNPSSGSRALREFGEHLTRAPGAAATLSTGFLYSDPSATEMLAKAVEEANDMSVEDVDELASQVRKILDPLMSNEHDPSGDELQKVKTFCLAFHRSMMAQVMPPFAEWDTVDGDLNFA